MEHVRQAAYRISLDGQDISNDLNPLLLNLSIHLTDDGHADSLSMGLDDTGGQIVLPKEGASVSAIMFWNDDSQGVEFEGFLDSAHSGAHSGRQRSQGQPHHGVGGSGGGGDVSSSTSRSTGRTLTVTAKSADMSGKLKEPFSAYMDDANFGDVAKKWGQRAGLDVQVESGLASIKRAYWGASNESFMSWSERHAHEIGATFKVYGKQGVFVPRAGGMSANGKALTPITAAWSVNLISSHISPVLSRLQFGEIGTRYYDPQQAAHLVEHADGSSSSESSVKHRHDWKAPNKDHAKHQSSANKSELDREKGGGSVAIDGEPAAQAGAMCMVSGVRDGVDGTYLISEVEHSLARSGGWVTTLTLKQPDKGAGTDAR